MLDCLFNTNFKRVTAWGSSKDEALCSCTDGMAMKLTLLGLVSLYHMELDSVNYFSRLLCHLASDWVQSMGGIGRVGGAPERQAGRRHLYPPLLLAPSPEAVEHPLVPAAAVVVTVVPASCSDSSSSVSGFNS